MNTLAIAHPEISQADYPQPNMVQDTVASLGPIFDEVIRLGNDRNRYGAQLMLPNLVVRPYYQDNRANTQSLQGLPYDEKGSQIGKLFFTGCRDSGEIYAWHLSAAPVSRQPASEDSTSLANTLLSPVAATWNAMTGLERSEYLASLRTMLEQGSRRRRFMARGSVPTQRPRSE